MNFFYYSKKWMMALVLIYTPLKMANASKVMIDDQFQKELKTQLINAKPGDTIKIKPGFYNLDQQMSLLVDNVKIQGAGIDKTILSFASQKDGAQGFYINANNFIIEDLTIQDTSGDGIKINESQNVTIRRVKVEWTRGPHMENGGYGFYPVLCENVLVEDSIAIAASDAGIYVGQSTNIIVRRNHAYLNVAGIEIENSVGADVYDNTLEKNTGGILVFSMPDLIRLGRQTRVWNNYIFNNNTLNFSPAKNTVADLPAGTGVMITANKNVEIFSNVIDQHSTTSILIVSYDITGRPINDPLYNSYAQGISIENNKLTNAGYDPKGGSSEFTQILVEILKNNLPIPFPHIIYDGSIEEDDSDKIKDENKICIIPSNFDPENNLFVNVSAPTQFSEISFDIEPHRCQHPKLPAIFLPFK